MPEVALWSHLHERAEPAAMIHQIGLLLMRIDCLLSYAGCVRKDILVRHGRHGLRWSFKSLLEFAWANLAELCKLTGKRFLTTLTTKRSFFSSANASVRWFRTCAHYVRHIYTACNVKYVKWAPKPLVCQTNNLCCDRGIACRHTA